MLSGSGFCYFKQPKPAEPGPWEQWLAGWWSKNSVWGFETSKLQYSEAWVSSVFHEENDTYLVAYTARRNLVYGETMKNKWG